MTKMIFQSRKDLLSGSIIFGTVLLLAGYFIFSYINNSITSVTLWIHLMDLIICGFLLWLWYGTHYKINSKYLHYQSGPIKGKIEISQIKEIVKNQTLWSGLKPALAKNGLIVKYGTYDEIYISPDTNDVFIEEILRINDNIIITENNHKK